MDMYERLNYFSQINDLKAGLEDCLSDYYEYVVKPSEIIRMLYIKLEVFIRKRLPVLDIISHMEDLVTAMAEHEKIILTQFIGSVDINSFPEEIITDL